MKKLIFIISTLVILCGFMLPNGRRYHSISEAPWGTAPWDMGWNMSFEGVEFCKHEDFLDSMVNKGYEIRENEKRYAILSGTFNGRYKDSKVVVYNKYGQAYLAEVYPKANRTWGEAKALYEELKQEFIINGDETLGYDTDENLNINHVREGKNYYAKIHRQFRRENAAYETIISVPGQGLIFLSIIPDIANPCGRWFWNKGKFQVRMRFRDDLDQETIN